jgi:hypothetical protein
LTLLLLAGSLVARVSDRAGNQASATVTFVVDTAAPTIQVTAPAAGAFVKTASPRITPSAGASGRTDALWRVLGTLGWRIDLAS